MFVQCNKKREVTMSKKQTLDMTQGNPLPLLVRFSIPLILG